MAWRAGLLLALAVAGLACDAAPHAGARRGSLAAAPGGGRRRLAAGTSQRCPPPSRDVLAARAKDNTLMYAVVSWAYGGLAGQLRMRLRPAARPPAARHSGDRPPLRAPAWALGFASRLPGPHASQMNQEQWDFGRNWLHYVKEAAIDYYLAVAADVPTSEALAAAGEPCVERIDTEAAQLGKGASWAKAWGLLARPGGEGLRGCAAVLPCTCIAHVSMLPRTCPHPGCCRAGVGPGGLAAHDVVKGGFSVCPPCTPACVPAAQLRACRPTAPLRRAGGLWVSGATCSHALWLQPHCRPSCRSPPPSPLPFNCRCSSWMQWRTGASTGWCQMPTWFGSRTQPPCLPSTPRQARAWVVGAGRLRTRCGASCACAGRPAVRRGLCLAPQRSSAPPGLFLYSNTLPLPPSPQTCSSATTAGSRAMRRATTASSARAPFISTSTRASRAGCGEGRRSGWDSLLRRADGEGPCLAGAPAWRGSPAGAALAGLCPLHFPAKRAPSLHHLLAQARTCCAAAPTPQLSSTPGPSFTASAARTTRHAGRGRGGEGQGNAGERRHSPGPHRVQSRPRRSLRLSGTPAPLHHPCPCACLRSCASTS